jgi:cell fate regulator YaaT (PSP1 superfamily)
MKFFQALEYLRYKMVRVAVADNVDIKSQQKVVLRSDKDLVVAKVITGIRELKDVKIDEDYEYIRNLTEEEWKTYDSDPQATIRVRETKEMVSELKIPMMVFASKTSFDNKVVVFFFTSEGNVDFRILVKKLASKYKKRILLRRVGQQERARILGGIGLCGREECCTFTYYGNQKPVMDAVRDQGIMIKHNSRIFGIDGRLKGCMMYERDFYRSQRKYFPHMKQRVKVQDRTGKVIGIDVVNKTVRIFFDDDMASTLNIAEVEYENKVPLPAEKPISIPVPEMDIFE